MNKPYHGSLLDPRTHGWKLVESWPTLFDLYIKGDEALWSCLLNCNPSRMRSNVGIQSMTSPRSILRALCFLQR